MFPVLIAHQLQFEWTNFTESVAAGRGDTESQVREASGWPGPTRLRIRISDIALGWNDANVQDADRSGYKQSPWHNVSRKRDAYHFTNVGLPLTWTKKEGKQSVIPLCLDGMRADACTTRQRHF